MTTSMERPAQTWQVGSFDHNVERRTPTLGLELLSMVGGRSAEEPLEWRRQVGVVAGVHWATAGSGTDETAAESRRRRRWKFWQDAPGRALLVVAQKWS